MSLTQSIYIKRSLVPECSVLNAAIAECGFDLKIDDFYNPFTSSGFLPCKFRSNQSGFEIYFTSSREIADLPDDLAAKIGDRDTSISLVWGSDMQELACVLIVSIVFAEKFDAIVYYEDDGLLYDLPSLKSELEHVLNDCRNFRTSNPTLTAIKKPKAWWKLW